MATPHPYSYPPTPRRVSLYPDNHDPKRCLEEEHLNQNNNNNKRRCTGPLPLILQALRGSDAKQGAAALRELYSCFLYDPRRIDSCVWEECHLEIVNALGRFHHSADVQIIAMTLLYRLCCDCSTATTRVQQLVQAGCMTSAVTAIQQFPHNATLITVAMRFLAKLLEAQMAVVDLLKVTVASMQQHRGDKGLLLQGCQVLGQLCLFYQSKRVFQMAGAVQLLEEILGGRQDAELFHKAECVLHGIHSLAW